MSVINGSSSQLRKLFLQWVASGGKIWAILAWKEEFATTGAQSGLSSLLILASEVRWPRTPDF